MKRKLVTFLLSFALIFGASGLTACKDNGDGNVTPPANEGSVSDTKLVNDTAKAFTAISQYDGSYTVTSSLTQSNTFTSIGTITTTFDKEFYEQLGVATPETQTYNYNDVSTGKDAYDNIYTYDGTTKKIGTKSTAKWETDDQPEFVSEALYSYIPTENGYTEYACEDGVKTTTALTQEEIEENIAALSEGVSTMLGVDIEKAKAVKSKEEVVSLFQEGAKKLTAEMNADTSGGTVNLSFSNYKAELSDELNKYTLTYQIKLSNVLLDEGYTETSTPTNLTISLYVKDEKLTKIEIDGTIDYSASLNKTETDPDAGFTMTGTGSITCSSTFKMVCNVSYAYDSSVIPSDFSDYIPQN